MLSFELDILQNSLILIFLSHIHYQKQRKQKSNWFIKFQTKNKNYIYIYKPHVHAANISRKDQTVFSRMIN